jgi:hypothetical protein
MRGRSVGHPLPGGPAHAHVAGGGAASKLGGSGSPFWGAAQPQRPSGKSQTRPTDVHTPPVFAAAKFAGQPGPTPGSGFGQLVGVGSVSIQVPLEFAFP